ncbi:MAG TPA: peptidoglycan-binding domain-containing protein, partial [Streptosporangiaceae bacterium]|nr:peptidoglycan-binding domain-containing protein [Streptosporangiaceae bacterium]
MNQDTDARQQPESGTAQAAATPAAATTPVRRSPDRDQRGRRGWVVAGVVIVVAAAAVGAALASGAFRGSGNQPAGASSGYQTGTATVTRQSLTSQTEEDATLGDAGTWSVAVPSSSSSSSSASASAGSGTFTWLPQVGQVIRQGQQIYGLSGSPVALLYGTVPAYRDLSEGLTGADVTELNRDLVHLGYATRAALGARSGWDYYSAETAYAVEQLQTRLGLTVTGTLPLGQAAFLPGPALVTGLGSTTSLGSQATAGSVVLTATSITPTVTIDLDPSLQSEVKDGDQVSITLPDGTITPGVVTQVGRVASTPSSGSSSSSNGQSGSSSNSSASGSGAATITVLVALTHPKAAGKLNQAPVTVTITTGSVSNALTVPVDALLAEPGGKYAVEVTGPGGHHLVTVTPGMFDD